MTKAKIDKDNNDYLTPGSQPAGERETAYKSQSEIEGIKDVADRNGNGDDVFQGSTKPLQGRRKADQMTTGASGDMGSGLGEMVNKLLKGRKISEDANPSDGAAATSDNPSVGGNSISASDFNAPRPDIKAVLESIALNAAESFEALSMAVNTNLPDMMTGELQDAATVLAKTLDYITDSLKQAPEPEAKPDPTESPVKESVTKMQEAAAAVFKKIIKG
jgi:hypothetical protein